MKKVLMASAILIGFARCNNSGKSGNETTKDTLTINDTVRAPKTADTSHATVASHDFPANFTPGKIFSADKADLHEQLSIQQLSDTKIAYELKMESGGCTSFGRKGVAVLKEGDAESDSDEKNNGYFVAEYMDEKTGECTVFIRIGADPGYTNRARFVLADCAKACQSKTESEMLFTAK